MFISIILDISFSKKDFRIGHKRNRVCRRQLLLQNMKYSFQDNQHPQRFQSKYKLQDEGKMLFIGSLNGQQYNSTNNVQSTDAIICKGEVLIDSQNIKIGGNEKGICLGFISHKQTVLRILKLVNSPVFSMIVQNFLISVLITTFMPKFQGPRINGQSLPDQFQLITRSTAYSAYGRTQYLLLSLFRTTAQLQ